MEGRWRKLLEQESEHQWLAIGIFFLFAILGGVAIEGTSTLAGVDLGAGDAAHDGEGMDLGHAERLVRGHVWTI